MAATRRGKMVLLALSAGGLLAGCAAQGAPGGDPGMRALPAGHTCQSVRGELNGLDRRGVPAKVEAVKAGRKVSPQDRADADRYNLLLSYYLGGRCHL